MSTEQSNSRKLNVQPATDAELFARFNTDTTKGDTEEAQQAAYEEYQDAYQQQLEAEEKVRDTRDRTKNMRNFGIIAGSALGVGALALAGANILGSTKTENESTTQPEVANSANPAPGAIETTAPTIEATPSPYSSPANTEALKTEKPVVTSDPSLRHESVIQHDLYDTLAPEVKDKIDRIASLTPEQVATMPLEDQLLFASFVRDNNEAHTRWRLETNGSPAYKKLLDAKPASATDTGEQVLAQGDMNAQIIFTLMPKGKTLDQTTAQKLTVLSISPESKAHANYNDLIASNTGGVLKPSTLSVLAEKSFNKDGVQYMILNLPAENGGVNQSTLRLQSYTDYNGETRATWHTILAVNSEDPRFDTSLSK